MNHPFFRKTRGVSFVSILAMLIFGSSDSYGWHDRTHLAISQAAGFDRWYSSAAPDVVKSRDAFRPLEEKNHYYNNNAERKITPEMVMKQVERINNPDDDEGHLYGAIIGSVRDYKALKRSGRFPDYPLVFCAHYIGDLSMPLHNIPYDAFNKERHTINDGIIECSALNNVGYIQRSIYDIHIENEEDLAREVARIAEISRKLGMKIRKENRNMTQAEAYGQVIHSASLFRAILRYLGKNPCI
ncbi:MAG: hypothetical protein K9I59_05000 [Chlorobium sp.]|uniref:hypothetical protein n=1 Tax=Chlorobium sp. TaxID=1095 RepID=UPI0025B86D78|nr:hypothetical protein [Chlorobium sp.]MCF8216135.1 hypothetical protein [Chlorobium sp.]MCF8271096.1 hypothetical protein [Chlorobium sp.]MCF8287410.1 hypothetical protein [Chlorobium sp.]MCF8291009.1 hypothetical protein [Chlorobium sp.]MCF8385104.1 hypothetical protein [Chlorobium sp.]